jgi:TctA family transporter
VWLLIPFILLGILFKKLDCSPAPLALGFVVGPMLEENLRRALTISQGDWMIFLMKPISLWMLIAALLILITSIIFQNRANLDSVK